MLTIENLSHRYPNGVQALSSISLDIGKGMFGLLGSNGAGKAYADALGQGTQADFAMEVEIGLYSVPLARWDFDPERDVVFVTRKPLVISVNEIELIADELLSIVGVDHYNRLIERNGNDNVRVVAVMN